MNFSRITNNGTTPGRHSKFDFPRYEKIFFAGHTKPRTLEISKAKQNFSGCLQDVWYNEVSCLVTLLLKYVRAGMFSLTLFVFCSSCFIGTSFFLTDSGVV